MESATFYDDGWRGRRHRGEIMFIQVIQGQVGDKVAARATIDRWRREIEPGAAGWLGGSYGFTDDGTLVAVVRFESKDAAQANSARPEQQAWWRDMEATFSGPITFHDCGDVTLLGAGGSDQAGFVQVIQGRVRDTARMRELAMQSASLISEYRPDVMGSSIAIDEDGYLTETVAFTSEQAARKAESIPLPRQAQEMLEQEMALLDDVRYLDLHQPWFATHS
jgi:hypothetical protein